MRSSGQVNQALLGEAAKHYRAALRQGMPRRRTASWSPGRARNCGSRRARGERASDRSGRRCGGMAARCTGRFPILHEYAFPRKKLLGALRWRWRRSWRMES